MNNSLPVSRPPTNAGSAQRFEYVAHSANVVFGLGASCDDRFIQAVDRLGATRILVIAADSEATVGEAALAALADRVVSRFGSVKPHVPVEVADAARQAARESEADALLSIGGGSATGTAKAVALTSGLPIIAIPTTYAGSEVTPVWGITEGSTKTTGVDPVVLPKLVVYDPELTLSLPRGLSAGSGVNAIAHCAEALWSPRRNPITSLIAHEAIRALASALPTITQDPHDLQARSRLLYGAWLAGTAFATTGSDLHHKICHVLGGAYDLPHAETHAVVLPHAAALAARRVRDLDEQLAADLGSDSRSAESALDSLNQLLGLPRTLRELGLRDAQLDQATGLVTEALSRLPEPVGRADVAALLRAAMDGTSAMSIATAT